MPQDSLWATSARATGLRIDYVHHQTGALDKHVLAICPSYSKDPGSRDGACNLTIPSYALWSMPEIIQAGIGQFLGGAPKHVGTVAHHQLQHVLREFEEGRRS